MSRNEIIRRGREVAWSIAMQCSTDVLKVVIERLTEIVESRKG